METSCLVRIQWINSLTSRPTLRSCASSHHLTRQACLPDLQGGEGGVSQSAWCPSSAPNALIVRQLPLGSAWLARTTFALRIRCTVLNAEPFSAIWSQSARQNIKRIIVVQRDLPMVSNRRLLNGSKGKNLRWLQFSLEQDA